jgi:hypothetical protein
MMDLLEYESLEEVITYLKKFLPYSEDNRINSVSKYARVQKNEVTVKAIKARDLSGWTWNFEVFIGV